MSYFSALANLGSRGTNPNFNPYVQVPDAVDYRAYEHQHPYAGTMHGAPVIAPQDGAGGVSQPGPITAQPFAKGTPDAPWSNWNAKIASGLGQQNAWSEVPPSGSMSFPGAYNQPYQVAGTSAAHNTSFLKLLSGLLPGIGPIIQALLARKQ